MALTKIWANSGDSHLMEPADLFETRLPADIADRMPSQRQGSRRLVGDSVRRRPGVPPADAQDARWDPQPRRHDRRSGSRRQRPAPEAEGSRPGRGVGRGHLPLDRGLVLQHPHPRGRRRRSPGDQRLGRRVPVGFAPLRLHGHDPASRRGLAIAEVRRATDIGLKASFLPIAPPFGRPPFAHEEWDPLWASDGRGRDGPRLPRRHRAPRPHAAHRGVQHGPGRRDPELCRDDLRRAEDHRRRSSRPVCSTGTRPSRCSSPKAARPGGPFMADRMDEAYRQHSAAVRPKLSKMPSEYLHSNVYASFQHDRSAVQANVAMGWKNVCGAATTPTPRGLTATRRRRSTSSLTTSTPRTATACALAPSTSSSRTSPHLQRSRTRSDLERICPQVAYVVDKSRSGSCHPL